MKSKVPVRRFPANFCLLATVLLLLACAQLFAKGKKEEDESPPINNDWILCITEFDSSSIPEARRGVADHFMRVLVDYIDAINYRLRISPEYAYYEDYAWSKARNAAAKALASKQEERAALLYQGEVNWRYRQNVKKRDEEIVKLREAYLKVESERPVINQEPEFKLSPENLSGRFPPPPGNEDEYRFCQNQNADAYLAGEIVDFHGRYYVTLRLYALYAREYVYEDHTIFSPDDLGEAVSEIAGILTAALAGTKPAAIAIHVAPPDALVLINNNFAGRGEVETREIPAGKATIALSAENHRPEIIEVDILPGELTDVSVTMADVAHGDMSITAQGKPGVSVYHGALYVGEAPLTLRLPVDQLDYISVKTKGGEEATAVFHTSTLPDEGRLLALKTKKPPVRGQNRINKARGIHYWLWGATWVTGLAAWITNGMYANQVAGYYDIQTQEMYAEAERMYYISTGALIALGVAGVSELFLMGRYIYTATEDVTPLVKTGIKK